MTWRIIQDLAPESKSRSQIVNGSCDWPLSSNACFGILL